MTRFCYQVTTNGAEGKEREKPPCGGRFLERWQRRWDAPVFRRPPSRRYARSRESTVLAIRIACQGATCLLCRRKEKSHLAVAFFFETWRRRWDSNPRYGYKPYASLAGMCLRPLGHVSNQLLTMLLVVAECRHINGHAPFGQGSAGKNMKKVKLSPDQKLYAGHVPPAPCIFRRSAPKS